MISKPSNIHPTDAANSARRAGADESDAVAVRSVSLSVEVRDGAVEESERSEGDDVGLRVFVGHRQAVVSTNDLRQDGLNTLAERAVAMARVAPEDRFTARLKLAKLPRNSSKTRIHHRCELSGRSKAFYRKVKLSRIALRELSNFGLVPGMTKASW